MAQPNLIYPGNSCQVPISFMCTFTPVFSPSQLPPAPIPGPPPMDPQLQPYPLSSWDDYASDSAPDYPGYGVSTSSRSYTHQKSSTRNEATYPGSHPDRARMTPLHALHVHWDMHTNPQHQYPRPQNAPVYFDPHQLTPTLPTTNISDHSSSSSDEPHKAPSAMYRTSLRDQSPHDDAPVLNVHNDKAREKHDMNHTPHEPLNAPHAPTRLHEPSTSHGPEPCSAPSFPQERNTKPRHRSGDKQRQNIPQSLEPLSSDTIRASILRHSPTLDLTGLQIEPSVTVDTIRLILRQTSVLESLGVKLISDSSPPMGNLDMVTSPSLESFTIKTTIHPGQLLSNLILPKLAHFTLNARHADFSRENDVGLFKLLTNSNCSLVNLSLLDVYPRQSELINCLRHNACETLRSLTVRSTLSPLLKTSFRRRCLDDATLVLLALRTKSGPGICPHLEHLELSHCDPTSDEVFVKMAKTRVGPGPFRLEYAFLSQGQISDAVARRLAVLATTHPLIFRSTSAQVITADNL